MKKTVVTAIAVSLLAAVPALAQNMGGNMQQGMMESGQNFDRPGQSDPRGPMMGRGYDMMKSYGMKPMMGYSGMPPCTSGAGYNMMGTTGMAPIMGNHDMMAMMHGGSPMMGGGMMAGPGMMGGPFMMQAQGSENLQKYESFVKETREMRKKLHDLMFDYGEARWNPATTIGDLRKMSEEISQLQEKIQQKMPQ